MTAIPLSRPASITDEEIAGGGEIHADAPLGFAESEPLPRRSPGSISGPVRQRATWRSLIISAAVRAKPRLVAGHRRSRMEFRWEWVPSDHGTRPPSRRRGGGG